MRSVTGAWMSGRTTSESGWSHKAQPSSAERCVGRMTALGLRGRLLLALPLLVLACGEAPTTPPNALLAKGGKKAERPEVSLVEYWVVPQEDGSSLIHVVADATGPIDEVRATASHDYFHNGISDDDYSPHFETIVGGIGPVPGGSGRFHTDLIFDGPWPDEPTTDIDGADPIVFTLRFWTDGFDTNTIYYLGVPIQPQGVVVNGQVVGTENIAVPTDYHAVATANSFALFEGTAAEPGDTVWVEELTLTNATCSKGRRKGQPVTRVEGDVTARLNNPEVGWMEFHFWDGSAISEPRTFASGSVSTHMVGEFDGHRENIDVELWLDYVDVVGDRMMVYDPARNTVATTLDPNAPIPAIAYVDAGTVNCR